MSQLWPVLLGSALTLVGGYLGAQWQARFAAEQQRGVLRYEQKIALYTDLFADCRARKFHILRTSEPYPPSASLQARADLLASSRTRKAWEQMETAEKFGVTGLHDIYARPTSAGKVSPKPNTAGLSLSEVQRVRLRLVESVEAAIRSELT